MGLILTETATSGALTAEQGIALTGSLTNVGNNVMSNFITVLPAVGVLTAIAFSIYFVSKKMKSASKGRA